MTDLPEKPGFEEIPIDLSVVPSVEEGIADAAERYKRFAEVFRAAMGDEPHAVLFVQHLPLVSFINRAASLHAGVVSAVKAQNPHAAFTLLRAYLELVVLVRYVDLHPEYLEELKRPKPEGKRKYMSELFEDAATEMVGVRHVYSVLSEMAHFGSTALWHPFTITDPEERTLRFGTGPHWKREDDPRTVLAMLQEADENFFVVLDRFASHHVTPSVESHAAWAHAAQVVADTFGGTLPGTGADEMALATLPVEVIAEALERGLLTECEEHQAIEVAEGVTPADFEAWAADRLQGEKDER
jgi:hypothetical protein